jgi:isopenicillin N synthase-like dioxygenase
VSTAFAESSRFFARPQEQKDALAWYSARANRGYVAKGREKVTDFQDKGDVAALRASIPDLKESMEIGRDDEADKPNMWPRDAEGEVFKSRMVEFFAACKEVHTLVMRAIAVGLGLEEKWFDGFTDRGDNTLRLLHYPEVDKKVFKREDGLVQVRAGEHSDYGMLRMGRGGFFDSWFIFNFSC